MPQWYLTCHDNAVNLDQARQLYVKMGRDGLYRVCAEFIVSQATGETISYSLESGLATEEDGIEALKEIIAGIRTGTGRPVGAPLEDFEIRQTGRQTGKVFAGRE